MSACHRRAVIARVVRPSCVYDSPHTIVRSYQFMVCICYGALLCVVLVTARVQVSTVSMAVFIVWCSCLCLAQAGTDVTLVVLVILPMWFSLVVLLLWVWCLCALCTEYVLVCVVLIALVVESIIRHLSCLYRRDCGVLWVFTRCRVALS